MAGGVGQFQIAKTRFFFEQALGIAHIAVQKDAHRQVQVGHQMGVHFVDLLEPGAGEIPAFFDFFVFDLLQDALDQIAHLLHVDGEVDHLGPALALALIEFGAGDFGQVVLDGGIQVVHPVVQRAQLLGQGGIVVFPDFFQAHEHGFDDVGLVQSLAGRTRNGQGGGGQCRGVQVVRPGGGEGGHLGRQDFFDHPGKVPGKLHTQQRHHQVEQQVKQHHLGTDIGHQRGNVGQPGLDQPDHGHHADHLEQQVAQRHLAHLHTGFERGQQGQHAAAQVGPQHQPQGHIARNAARAGQGRHQQHGGQAGVGNDGQHRAGDDLQRDVAGDGQQQRAHRLGLGEHQGGLGNQAQGQQHQPQADQNAANAPGGGVLAGNKEHHAGEDAQRRQPGQVQREHHRHQAGAHIRPQHDDQGRGQRNHPLPHKGRNNQRCGRAGLHDGRHPHAREQGRQPRAHAPGDELAQVGTKHAQDARAHHLDAPHQQGNSGQKIE